MEDMLELHSDPEVHQYLGNKTINSLEEIKKIIDFLKQQYGKYKVGRWAMIDKNSYEFIGWTGIEYVTKEINGHKNFYDLGYRLKKQYWGKGYATESAIASIEYAFNQLQANQVYAMADCKNKGSNNILTKVGMRFIESFDFEGVKYNWYKIEKVK